MMTGCWAQDKTWKYIGRVMEVGGYASQSIFRTRSLMVNNILENIWWNFLSLMVNDILEREISFLKVSNILENSKILELDNFNNKNSTLCDVAWCSRWYSRPDPWWQATAEPLSRYVPASPCNINHRCNATQSVMWILLQLQCFSMRLLQEDGRTSILRSP